MIDKYVCLLSQVMALTVCFAVADSGCLWCSCLCCWMYELFCKFESQYFFGKLIVSVFVHALGRCCDGVCCVRWRYTVGWLRCVACFTVLCWDVCCLGWHNWRVVLFCSVCVTVIFRRGIYCVVVLWNGRA